MSRRPRVGITVHLGAVERLGREEARFELTARYAQAVRDAGGVPLLVPTDSAEGLGATLDALDGLLLSGGGSLPAAYFEANPDPTLRQTNPVRYDVEVALVRSAWERDMPLMGICRGHQTIAEALGGELIRDVRGDGRPEHYQEDAPTVRTHALAVEDGSRLARLVGSAPAVNSFHRQAVVRVPAGWRVVARSPDGLVEAMEAERGFGVGCQFHPEWLVEEPGFAALFAEFVAAGAAFGASRKRAEALAARE